MLVQELPVSTLPGIQLLCSRFDLREYLELEEQRKLGPFFLH